MYLLSGAMGKFMHTQNEFAYEKGDFYREIAR